MLLQKLLSCCLQYSSINKNAIISVQQKLKKGLSRCYKKLALIYKTEEKFSRDNRIQ